MRRSDRMPELTLPSFIATPEQLSFPYIRNPSRYGISPHGLRVWATNPVLFYFKYVGPKEYNLSGFKQTEPMAVGAAVDGLVKQAMLNDMDLSHWRGGDKQFDIWCEVDEEWRTDAIQLLAHRIMSAIGNSPLIPMLKDFYLIDMETRRDTAFWVHGVPTNGRLDFLLGRDGDPQNTITDLKVNGSCSTTGSTPIPGYKWKYEFCPHLGKGRLSDTPHKKAGRPMEELHIDYATQLATYALQEDAVTQETTKPFIFQPTPVQLWQVTFKPPSAEPKTRKDGTKREWFGKDGKIVVTLIDSYVSGAFKHIVLEQYRTVWNQFQSRTLIPQDVAEMGLPFAFVASRRSL